MIHRVLFPTVPVLECVLVSVQILTPQNKTACPPSEFVLYIVETFFVVLPFPDGLYL